MSITKEIKGRIVLKHDTAANWKTAGDKGFCPLANEIIMFDPDDSCAMIRYKIGRWANEAKTELVNINDLPFEANLMYVEQQLTEEQKKVARENIGATNVVNNGTHIDKFETKDLISYNGIIQNTNPFGGKRLYINSLDNAFSGFTRKYWVQGTYHKIKDENGVEYPHVREGASVEDADYWVDGPQTSGEPLGGHNMAALFDNAYEGGLRIPVGSYLKIHMRFSNEEDWTPKTGARYPAYPYGTFYISYYGENRPSKTRRSQFRCYNTFEAHGIGWKRGTFKYYLGDNNSAYNVMESHENTGSYGRTCMEFLIFSPDESEGSTVKAGPVCLEWQLNRPSFSSTTPFIHNFSDNSLYTSLICKKRRKHDVIVSAQISPQNGFVGATEYGLYNPDSNSFDTLPMKESLFKDLNAIPQDGEILVYDAASNRMVKSGYTFETLFDKMYKMIDTYMNTSITIEENDAGGATQSIDVPPEAVTTSANDAGGETLNIGG